MLAVGDKVFKQGVLDFLAGAAVTLTPLATGNGD